MRVYRIKNAVRAVLTENSGSRLTELPAGSVVSLTTMEPDSTGMIVGTSGERTVQVFLNDLEHRAELMNIKIPPATVRVVPQLSRS
jgi:hypothetical protein